MGQIEVLPEIDAVGLGLTVTTVLLFEVFEHVLLSETFVTVYVVLVVGLTGSVYGDDAILLMVTGVVPSVYVKDHGDEPDNATDKFVFPPLQIVAAPLIETVGFAFTVIIELLVALFEHVFASRTEVI